MKISYTIILLLFSAYFCFAKVWQGDYLIESQADADAFRSVCNCTSINGNLIITGDDIEHADSLFAVIDINGGLEISNTLRFRKFDGLRHIRKIKFDLKIKNNQLNKIEGFDLLKSIGGALKISENGNLEEIQGFERLEDIGETILIESNHLLKQFSIFKKLEHCGGLRIKENNSLSLVEAFDNLTQIDRFAVWRNKDLEQIIGFNRIETIKWSFQIFENASLKTIEGFTKLKKVGVNFQIDYNDQLLSISSLDQLECVVGGFDVWLPKSIIKENHFKNLNKVGNHFSTNIANFDKLNSVGCFEVSDRHNIDTLTCPTGIKKIEKIVINNNEKLTHIIGFNDLEQVLHLSISNHPNLKQIEGFNKLKLTDLLWIIDNSSLQTIVGFEGLKNINRTFNISSNYNLTNIFAFNHLEVITGDCTLDLPSFLIAKSNFNSLKDIEGVLCTNTTNFKNLETVGTIKISDDFLGQDTLTGFSKLKKAEYIYIANNAILKHMNAFPKLETVSGNIHIINNKNLNTISGFDNINTIEVDLDITRNTSLKNILGFQNLCSVNWYFSFDENRNISEFDAFNSLIQVGHLRIMNNIGLEVLKGFKNLQYVSGLQISNNLNATQIAEFNNLTKADYVLINANQNLQKINGFSSLTDVGYFNRTVGGIQITRNNSLLSIEGFDQLVSANNLNIENRNLRQLEAFKNLKVVGNLNLSNNIQLRSIDNFSSINHIYSQLVLQKNLQLNSCCIVNCWLSQKVVDESNLVLSENSTACSLSSIKSVCEEQSCIENELILSNLKTNNPVTTQLQFSFLIFEDQPIQYKIFNINEQLISKGLVIGNKGYNFKTIELPKAKRGFYFLLLADKDAKEVIKFLKL